MRGEVLVQLPAWLAKKNGLAARLHGTEERRTEKAVLVRPDGTTESVWLPLSQITFLPTASVSAPVAADGRRCSMCSHVHGESEGEEFGVLDDGTVEWLCHWCQTDRYPDDPFGDFTTSKPGPPPPFDDDGCSNDDDYREGWDSEVQYDPSRERDPATVVTEERFEDPVRVTVEDLRIVVRSPFRLRDRLKDVAGSKWDPDVEPKGAWTYPATPGAADALAAALRGETVDADDRIVGLRRTTREADERKRLADEDLPTVPSRTKAWTHQARAYHFAKDLPAAMLAMDMGTGKSKVAVDLACAAGARRVLVLCPKSVVGVWPREFGFHADCPVEVVAPRRGPKGGELNVSKRADAILAALDRQRRREEEGSTTQTGGTLVVVVNYESAWRDPMAAILMAQDWDVVVLDESHRIKAPGGKASRFCERLGRRAKKRLCLTGTPMPHSPLDVYAQYRFLDPGIFGTSFVSFRSHYAIVRTLPGTNTPIVDGYQREDELAEKMYRIGYRVMADDVLDLPPTTMVVRSTMLAPAAQKIYDSLAKTLVADLADGTVSAANALVRILRLQQVTSGWLPLDEADGSGERPLVEIGTEKRDLLADVLSDIPAAEPIAVACRFTGDLDAVRYVCEHPRPGEPIRRYGELSGRSKDGLADDATMSADIDVLGVQIQAGGVGIDLTRAAYVVNYSVGYSLGDWEQWLKRTHRPGQTRHVAYANLVCEGTVDEHVYSALSDRKDLVEFVLGLSS